LKKIKNKREIKAGVTWITRFFLKRALVCSRWLAPMALLFLFALGEAEKRCSDAALSSAEDTGFELGGLKS